MSIQTKTKPVYITTDGREHADEAEAVRAGLARLDGLVRRRQMPAGPCWGACPGRWRQSK